MILNDEQILELCTRNRMITPFETQLVRTKNGKRVVSYGVSSFGYDIRLGTNFKYMEPSSNYDAIIDPIDASSENAWVSTTLGREESFIIPPHGLVLGHSLERFEMPTDVIAICLGKSTYARCGLIVNVTPLEPGWTGWLTIELTNTSPRPLAVHVGQGIAQLLFFRGAEPFTSYADRGGKYQNQQQEAVVSRA